jgi:hypothetical protein
MQEIDMQSYTGEVLDQAAAGQSTDTNSYLQEANDVFVPPDMQIKPQEQAEVQPSKQELNFSALRNEVDRLKAERESERRVFQDQLDMLRSNMRAEPKQPEVEPRKMFDGMQDDDVPNVGELRREWQAKEAAYQSRLEEMEVAQRFNDYAEVVEKYTVPLIKEKPHLVQGIQGAQNKALFAYELGKMAQQIRQVQAQPQQSETAQRIVENARKPGTLSQAGGQSVLSKADYIATMSDAEFYKFASRNLDQI